MATEIGELSSDQLNILQGLVLSEISDDYESLDSVVRNVGAFVTRLELTVDELQIWTLLRNLITDGLARAYELSPKAPPLVIHGVPLVPQSDQVYYWITEKGRTVLSRVDWAGIDFD